MIIVGLSAVALMLWAALEVPVLPDPAVPAPNPPNVLQELNSLLGALHLAHQEKAAAQTQLERRSQAKKVLMDQLFNRIRAEFPD